MRYAIILIDDGKDDSPESPENPPSDVQRAWAPMYPEARELKREGRTWRTVAAIMQDRGREISDQEIPNFVSAMSRLEKKEQNED